MSEINERRVAQSRLRKLEAAEVHARQRYEFYLAKSEGPDRTEAARLKELERLSKLAQSRVAEARESR